MCFGFGAGKCRKFVHHIIIEMKSFWIDYWYYYSFQMVLGLESPYGRRLLSNFLEGGKARVYTPNRVQH